MKVAIIGAGSTVFMRNIVRDLSFSAENFGTLGRR